MKEVALPEETQAAAAKPLPSPPTLCDPTDGSPPGSSVPGKTQDIQLNLNFSKQIIVLELTFNWVFYISFTKSSKPTKSQRTVMSENHPAQQARGRPRTQKY